ncbi:MAG: (1--_2) glucan export composite transrane/ATP-binding protein [Candidatus Saccharibacteria bacterium]|nr:(1-->2) glucan export composite transrane/ATP-binding protein [Candidatus Saccharibacteria bacterium]
MKDLLRILASARHLRSYYWWISGLTILLALSNALVPLLSGMAIDQIRQGSSTDVERVVIIAFAIFALDVLANLFSNVGGYLGDQLSVKLQRYLSRRYYEHLMRLPQQFYDTELTGKLINQLNRSISQITQFVHTMSNNFLQFIFSTVFTLIIVAHYSLLVAVLFLAIYPIYTFLTVKSSPKWLAWQKQKNHHQDVASGRFAEVINQIKVVKSFIQEKHELNFFNREYRKVVEVNRPQSKHWHRHDVFRRLILALLFLAVYLIIFVQAAHGTISPGVAVALVLYGLQIRTPIFTISFLVDAAQRVVGDSREYLSIMDTKPQIVDKPGAIDLQVDTAAVRFENVHFHYKDGKPVLRGLDFEVAPNSKLALVGESGEGKTTLTNLLMRLYEPDTGRILIDGQDIAGVTQRSLRSKIGVVFQEPALFSGTIRENIAYAKPGASDDEVMAAAKAANAHDFISKFKNGYHSEIGERGLKLSGGQKQRIAIARALLKDAPILILDEATSSLDSRSELTVQAALARLMKGRTTIIIAHRLSTIEHVDRIVTLQNGQVDEIGSPTELAESGGIYSQLLKLQQRHNKSAETKLKQFGIRA